MVPDSTAEETGGEKLSIAQAEERHAPPCHLHLESQINFPTNQLASVLLCCVYSPQVADI